MTRSSRQIKPTRAGGALWQSMKRRSSSAPSGATGFRDDETPEPRDNGFTTQVGAIECSTCSALLEIYPQDVPGGRSGPRLRGNQSN